MDVKMIFGDDVTLEQLYNLSDNGIEFVVEDGCITEVIL